jgi:hypothetical protein
MRAQETTHAAATPIRVIERERQEAAAPDEGGASAVWVRAD